MDEPGCNNCKHWRGGFFCDAYPEGIPWPIMSGQVSHLVALPEDNGIQYEQASAEELAAREAQINGQEE